MGATRIVDGLYSIPAGQVNAFFLDAPEGGVLIDAGVAGKAPVLLKALAELGKGPADIRHILITHAHPDHMGSVAAMQRETGAEVYVHTLDAEIVRTGTGFRPLHPAPGLFNTFVIKMIRLPAQLEPTEPLHQLDDGQTLPFAGGLRVIHTPGHCLGQVAFLWKEHGGVLLAADAAMHLFGLALTIGYEDLAEGKRSLQKLAREQFEVACFGHGRPILKHASAQFRRLWPVAS